MWYTAHMDRTLTAHRPLRADAIANRERILGAARVLFAAHGANTEMREIAERAGVGVGTLYRHFTNRDELFFALLDQTHTATLARLREAASVTDPRDALRAVAHVVVRAYATYGALFEAMHVGGGKQCVDFSAHDAIIAGIVERGVAAGLFRADADVPTAVIVLTTCAGGPHVPTRHRPPAETADALADFVLAALAPPAARS